MARNDVIPKAQTFTLLGHIYSPQVKFKPKNMICEKCKTEISQSNIRTIKQNSSIYLYFRLLADALNNAGFDLRETIREDIDIPWSGESVKAYLWKPIQKALLRKQSTAELEKSEVDKIYGILNREIGNRTGVFVPFPSIESLPEYDH